MTARIEEINGYKIVLIPNRHTKIIYVQGYILSGRMNEDDKISGISHLLEHVLTEAWKKCEDDCAKYWGKKGIITNASTGDTTINYYVEGLHKNCKEIIEYIIQITTNPQINNSRVDREKLAVREELKREQNDPGWRIASKISNIFYNHKGLQNGNNLPLQISNLKKFNARNLLEFCEEIYTPKNILFVISGNFKSRNVLKTFREFLPKNVKRGKRNIKYNVLKDITRPATYFIRNKGAKIAEIVVAFNSPIFPWEKMSMYFHMIMDILAGGMHSLLMRRLRSELNLIYNIKVYIEPEITGTLTTIETTGDQDKTGEIVNAIKTELTELINGGLTDEQITRIKDRYIIHQDKLCRNNIFWGDFYGEQYINQLYKRKPKIYSYKQRVQIIKDVTKDEIIVACKKLFPLDKMICVYQCQTKQHF